MSLEIRELYGKRVRIRICGLCWKNDKLLMVSHAGLTDDNFWSPPGGGIEFGETAAQALKREVEEETGIVVKPGKFLFVSEFIKEPLHAVELFFEVFYESGELRVGHDPEMAGTHQIIQDVKWMSPLEIKSLSAKKLHGIFQICQNPTDLMKLNGYWSI